MRNSGKIAILFFCLLSFFLLVACANESQTAKDLNSDKNATNKEKIMFVGINNPPTKFVAAKSSSSLFITEILFESLLSMPAPLVFEPKLAESFESADNQTFTIKLNPAAKWTDGEQITAEDVAFTLNWTAHPKSDTPGKPIISILEGVNAEGMLVEGESTISGVKVINEHELTLTTKASIDPNYVKELLGTRIRIMPKHILKDIDPEMLSQHPFTQQPTVTSGAFKFVKYEKDQYVELVANQDYYLGTPKLDKIFIKIMPATNLVAQLKSGELHMNGGASGVIPVQDYETVESMENVTTKSEPGISFQTMMFNTKTIADKKVRQAIAYGVNRQLIVDNLLKGYGEVIDGPYTSIHPYLNKNLEPITYNPGKAKQLLKEANWDGNRELELVVAVGDAVREQTADIIAENLKDIGVKVKISKFDFPTTSQKAQKGEFDLQLIGFPLFVDPDVSIVYGSGAPYNYPGYSNSEADELLMRGKSEPDPTKRHEIYDRLQEIWQEDMPFLTTYSLKQYSVVSKKVTVGEPKVFGMLNNLHEWDIED